MSDRIDTIDIDEDDENLRRGEIAIRRTRGHEFVQHSTTLHITVDQAEQLLSLLNDYLTRRHSS